MKHVSAATTDHVHQSYVVDYTLERDLNRVRRLARALDDQFSLAGIKFGWDSIIGLIPGLGDAATTTLSLYPIFLAHRHGLGVGVIFRMLWNVLLDFLIGLMPVIGDLLDIGFKANRKNLAIFEKAAHKRRGH